MELIIAVLFIIFIYSAIMTAYAGWIGAPFVKTPDSIVREILKEADLKAGEKLYELGSGTGGILIIAEKFFNATPLGFEISPFLYLISRINLIINKTKFSKVFLKNFYNVNMSGADVVFAYLTPYAMNKLGAKFKKELKPGARVISYAFHIDGWGPKKVIRKENFPPVFIYVI